MISSIVLILPSTKVNHWTHALNFRLLLGQQREAFPGCGNNFIAAPPRSIQRAKSADV
jgi:hypothetical protein